MNENRKVRETAWLALFRGRWIIPLVWFWVIATSLVALVSAVLKAIYKVQGLQTWTDFTMARAQHLLQGLDYTVPSAALERQMHLATGFELFVSLILTGMTWYGLHALVLRTTTNDRSALIRTACGGLARPLDCAWLLFRQSFQIVLWAFLFIIPGIVAAYAYSQAWFLKAEHPDWRAGKCLAESKRLMKGAKWNLFFLDCSFWLPILVVTVAPLIVPISVAVLGQNMLSSLIGLFASLATAIAFIYFSTGRAVFYIAVRDASATAKDREPPAQA